MPKFTNLAGPFVVIPSTLLLYIFGRNNIQIKRMALLTMLSLSFSHIFVQLLKHKISRLRPGYVFNDIYIFKNFKDYSFPSGHTTAAFTMAISTLLFYQSLGVFLLLIAFLIGLSRMYLGVHYPSDVIMGALIGTVFPFILHVFV